MERREFLQFGITRRASVRWSALTAAGVAALFLVSSAAAQVRNAGSAGPSAPSSPAPLPDDVLKGVRLEQKLDAEIPKDITFRDETGKTVRLGDYLGKKPLMLNLIFYRCTMLCSTEMKVLGESLKELKFTIGDQFNAVTVSIDPREQPDLAMEYKQGYLKQYNRPGAENGWHFLTGDKANIDRLADAVGFHYVHDLKTDQFAHPDGVVIITPDGHIARYFFRLNYAPNDLRLGLVEAAKNRIGSPLDALALLCYHYNPETGKYGLAVMKLIRVSAIGTVLLMGGGLLMLGFWDRNRRRREAQDEEKG